MIKKIRIILSTLILIILALLLMGMSDRLSDVFSVLERAQFIPALLSFTLGFILFWLISSFLFGRAYCSTVCPMGTFQDLVSCIKRVCTKKPYRYSIPRNSMRYSILILIIASLFVIHKDLILLFDPYTQYKSFIETIIHPTWDYICGSTFVVPAIWGLIFALISFVIVGIFSYRYGRLFCNSICPIGSTLSLVSRHSIFQFEVDTDLCTHCGKCIDNCKSSCIRPAEMTVDMSRCVMCFNCVDACNDNAIRYSASRKRLSTPLMQPLKDIPQVTVTNIARSKRVSTIRKTKNQTI